MKPINWNREKNKQLQEDRGVSFELIRTYIENEQVHSIVKHPDREKQRIFIIVLGEDVLYVPFVETDEEVFLKTIYKNSKAKRRLEKDGKL